MIIYTARQAIVLAFAAALIAGPLKAQPISRRSDITVRELGNVGFNTVRIRRDPVTGDIYILQNNGIIQRVNFNSDSTAVTLTTVYTTADHGLHDVLGMTFGKDGTMYLVGNDSTGLMGTATIVKGVPDTLGSDKRTWSVIATTVPYPYGEVYNHRMSGIVLNPTGDSLYINSGAGTDHGEKETGGYRNVGLTALILRIPVDGKDILLQDNRQWLIDHGYVFCTGIRNAFDFAYDGYGDLIEVENSGDRDDPEEMNWLREGLFYGFPWRISTDVTPQQFTPYDPHTDPLLSPNAWGGGDLYKTFSEDSTYPQAPDSLVFTNPIPSYGPDADHFRDTLTGKVEDASVLGTTISTFTPHLSPDGIVFDRDSLLAGDLKGGGFVVCLNNSSLITALGDTGMDLLLVKLKKDTGAYTAHVYKLVTGFNCPLAETLVGNKLYIVETGLFYSNNSPRLWLVTLPEGNQTAVRDGTNPPASFRLDQNYPNPFNPTTRIEFSLQKADNVVLAVYNVLGQRIRVLARGRIAAGEHFASWNGRDEEGRISASGVYFCRLTSASGYSATRKMVFMK